MSDKQDYYRLTQLGWQGSQPIPVDEIYKRLLADNSMPELKKINLLGVNLFITKVKSKPLLRLDDIYKYISFREGLRGTKAFRYPMSHHTQEIANES